jgi:hypothetical protein
VQKTQRNKELHENIPNNSRSMAHIPRGLAEPKRKYRSTVLLHLHHKRGQNAFIEINFLLHDGVPPGNFLFQVQTQLVVEQQMKFLHGVKKRGIHQSDKIVRGQRFHPMGIRFG